MFWGLQGGVSGDKTLDRSPQVGEGFERRAKDYRPNILLLTLSHSNTTFLTLATAEDNM